ncbi:MAG: hypothetical protein U0575_01145 [Phycisphaerales bacterium]
MTNDPTSFSRRTFLAAGAAFAAGSLAHGSPRIRTDDKAGAKRPVVGDGAFTYECIHDWATPPAEIAFGNTHGVAVDRDGLVYIKHTVHASSAKPDAICVFDPQGAFVRSFGAEFRGGAHGLLLSREPAGDFLYLADCGRGVVVKTDLRGNEVWRRGVPDASGLYGAAGEYKPTNVAIVPHDASSPGAKPFAGHFFVADGYGKSWIHHYDADANYVRSFGGPGKERGQVACPHGIFLDTRQGEPRLVVADRSNHRLQYFSLDGRHLGLTTAELRSPCHFDQRGAGAGGVGGGDARGPLLLIPDLDARVTIFDRDDKLVVHLGDGENYGLRDKPREQFVPGRFIAPHSACWTAEGDILVVEWVEVGRVTKLRHV